MWYQNLTMPFSSIALSRSALFLYVGFSLNLGAQDSDAPTVDEVLEQQGADVSRHIPTNQKGAEESAKIIAKAVEPSVHKIQNPEQFQRILELRKRHASFMESFSKGEARPFPEVAKNWQTYVDNVADMEDLYQRILEEKDETKRQELTDAFVLALQPIGFLLEAADHEGAPIYKLTEEQKAAHDQLEKEFYAAFDADVPEDKQIQLLSRDHA